LASKATGVILLNTDLTPVLRRGLDRIRQLSPDQVDLLHHRRAEDSLGNEYSWILTVTPLNEPARGKETWQDLESWEIEVSAGEPAQIGLNCTGERGRLYALYHIAACLEQGKEPSQWAAERKPLLEKRYAWVGAGNCWYDVYRPDLFEHDLRELPAMGFNGILLVCNETEGTSAGRQPLPLSLTEGGVKVDRYRLRPYQWLFERLKSYALDICIFHQAYLPPQYSLQEVHEYYNGQRDLPGFEEKIKESSRDLAEALFRELPQIDSLLFHSLECAWFWGHAAAMFPSKDDAAAERALRAYLDGLGSACSTAGKDLLFWTHVSGVSPKQLRLMREVVLDYPEVLLLEDQAHENEHWLHCPVMGHVPQDLIEAQSRKRFGLAINTTDGEYYGAGSLPTAYPEPHIRAAQTALELKMELGIVRLNEQSATPLGTLQDINAIHISGVSEKWWTPERPLEELWLEWCARRFSQKAARQVAAALQKSADIMTKGFSVGKMALMNHNGLKDSVWRRGNNWGFEIFDKPGELIITGDFEDLRPCDLRAWQVEARGASIEDFLRSSKEGENAALEALELLESVKSDLSSEDYTYLTSCFQDSLPLIEGIRSTALAAYATSQLIKKPGEEQKQKKEQACAAMESLADKVEAERGLNFLPVYPIFKITWQGKEYKGYGLPIALRGIAQYFRSLK